MRPVLRDLRVQRARSGRLARQAQRVQLELLEQRELQVPVQSLKVHGTVVKRTKQLTL